MELNLRAYLDQAERGAAARIAKALGVHPVMVSQWANGPKPVPDDRAPALEWHTEFKVRCEKSCPTAKWVRVPDPDWPHGKPLLDKAPQMASADSNVAVRQPADAPAAAEQSLYFGDRRREVKPVAIERRRPSQRPAPRKGDRPDCHREGH